MVYLIHFDQPFHHAQHYIGFCDDGKLQERFDRHLKGDGAKIIRAAMEAGIQPEIVRTWPEADRLFERQMKNRKNAKKLCPICRTIREEDKP